MRFARIVLITFGVSASICAEPLDSKAHVDPQILEVLSTKDEAEVIISFHLSNAPAVLGKTQKERAEKLGEARETEFSAKLKALTAYLGKDADQLVITRMSPISVSLTAIISSREMLDRIAAFPLVRAIHYAKAKNQIESSSGSPSTTLVFRAIGSLMPGVETPSR